MILVAGASGNVGREVVSLCESNGVDCIALGRKNLWGKSGHVEQRYFDLEDPRTFYAAKDATKLFLVRPPQISNVKKTIAPFLRQCREFGVEQVVFLSILGANKLPFIPHYKIEKEIERLGFRHTFLRAGFFMQNLSTSHAEEIRERNELVAPAGNGKTTFVHARDIAEIGFKALNGEIRREALDVAGSDTLTYGEIAEKLSTLLGRKITYRSPSPPAFVYYRVRHGTPMKFAMVMAGIYMPTRFGGAEYHGGGIGGFLGRPPIGIDRFLEEEKATWE
jgi:uncharacterized protein YbjT (DUF2867 family)